MLRSIAAVSASPLADNAPQMNAHDRNTVLRPLVALAGCAAIAWVLLGCGGSQNSAQSIVNDTFHSHRQIDSGRLSLSLELAASGVRSLKAPLSLGVRGPFQDGGPGLPRFGLEVDLALGGRTVHAGVVSTDGKFFISLEGTPFQAPPSTMAALEQSYALSGKRAAPNSRSTFTAIGVNPGEWLEHPVVEGTETLAGVKTVHLVAGLNLPRFLADTAKLSGAGGALGLNRAAPATGLLNAQQSTALTQSLTSGRVDLYTGVADHLLRRLSVQASFTTKPGTREELQGLRHATLDLQLGLADLNQPQEILAPSNPRPLSELVSQLQQLGLAD